MSFIFRNKKKLVAAVRIVKQKMTTKLLIARKLMEHISNKPVNYFVESFCDKVFGNCP